MVIFTLQPTKKALKIVSKAKPQSLNLRLLIIFIHHLNLAI